MKIDKIELMAADLKALKKFYTETLELPVSEGAEGEVTVQSGQSTIVFRQAKPGWTGAYHFAFNLPENRFAEAKTWIEERVSLIADKNGQTEFNFESWNAHSVYFYDPAGNVLEFIARHSLPNAIDGPFTPAGILSVSEIGVTTDNVPSSVDRLHRDYGLETYDGAGSEEFTAVGDEEGLLIVVRVGRIWFPDTGKAAGAYPVAVNITTPSGEQRNLSF